MTEKRFIIDCYGIIDTWKSNTGKCEKDKLSWTELCETLNQLNKYANNSLEEYQYIVSIEEKNRRLQRENDELRNTLKQIHNESDV